MSEHTVAQQQNLNKSEAATKDTDSFRSRNANLSEQNTSQEHILDGISGSFLESSFGYDFSRVPVHTNIALQTMPLLRTQPMVQRFPKDGDAENEYADLSTCATCPETESTEISAGAEPTSEAAPIEAETSPTSEPSETTEETATPEEIASPGLIVEDSAEEIRPGQMRKSEFLAQLRTEVCRTVETAIAETGQTTDSCPYIGHWFDIYGRKESTNIERAIRRYASEASNATTARRYISAVTQKARQSAETWARTGEITGAPEGVPTTVPGEAPTDNGQSAATATSPVMFKAREGGSRAADDPQAIQAELGDGLPLSSGVRSRMESAFGMDFVQVRTHTDSTAAGLSNRFNARAFTVGKHVAFGSNEYKPGTLIGDALIAHELAHVVQQSSVDDSIGSMEVRNNSYNALEEDADQTAVGAMASIWGNTKVGLAKIALNAVSCLRSGLRLQRCNDKKCKVKSGPTYTPNGTIKATASGGVKKASFNMSAEFEHDPSKDFYASCCEVRQDILWTNPAEIPNHAGFKPASNFSANTWYEDRDGVGKRYGHRTGSYSECISVNHYEDSSRTWNCASGSMFKGRDDPMDGSGAKTGEWRFRLRVVETCNKDKDVGGIDTVTVDW